MTTPLIKPLIKLFDKRNSVRFKQSGKISRQERAGKAKPGAANHCVQWWWTQPALVYSQQYIGVSVPSVTAVTLLVIINSTRQIFHNSARKH